MMTLTHQRPPRPGGELTEAQRELTEYQTVRHRMRFGDIALPAEALRNEQIAAWVKRRGILVDASSRAQMRLGLSTGVLPVRIAAHAHALTPQDVLFAASMGLGYLVVDTPRHIELLSSVAARRQNVVVHLSGSGVHRTAGVVDSVMTAKRLNLVGLRCAIGPVDQGFVSCPAGIGHLIGEMARIHREHRVVVSRLFLAIGHTAPASDGCDDLADVASQIDESLDDACATLRFPRPAVVVSTSLDVTDRRAA
jgi:diaminopimelate decarboxylase